MIADTKQAIGGPFDGEWFPAIDQIIVVPTMNDDTRFAMYEDKGLRFVFMDEYVNEDEFTVIDDEFSS